MSVLAAAGHPRRAVAVPLPWMVISPSVRSAGLGWAGGAITDPFVGFYNPGGLGVYSLEGRSSIAHISTDLTFDRVDKNTFFTLGMPLTDLGGSGTYPRVAIGYAYHRRRAGIKDVKLSDGTTQSYIDRYSGSTMAIAVEYGAAVGIGVSTKDAYNSVSKQSFGCHDVGIYASVPVFPALVRAGAMDHIPVFNVYTPEITTIVSYAWANRGGRANSYVLELPRHKLFAISATGGLRYHGARVAAFTFTRDERLDEPPFDKVHSEGWEFDMLGIAQIRGGNHWSRSRDDGTSASGISLYLHGLTEWIGVLRARSGDAPLPWYVRALDVAYHRASWESQALSFLGESHAEEFDVILDLGELLH